MKPRHHRGSRLVGLCGAVTALFGLTACRGDDADAARRGLSTTSLRANRVPAHVVGERLDPNDADAGTDSTSRHPSGDAGVALALPLKDFERLTTDALGAREDGGVLLDAEWRWTDVAALPPGAPEMSPETLEALRSTTRLRMRIEVAAAGRINIAFIGNGYPWADGTELRARADRLGHILVWPNWKHYRNVVPGTLRAMFSDRRLDRGLLFTPKVTSGSPGTALGLATTRQALNTPVGELQLEQANLAAVGIGGVLLCRFLVELVGIDPNTSLCVADQLVLRANLTNAPGGKLQFVVNQMSRKQDLPISAIQVPPDGASFETSGMPIATMTATMRSQLTAMRVHAIPTPPPAKDAPTAGLIAVNRTLTVRALLIDGIPVAWLPPGTELSLPEMKNGSYSIGWRDFFGTTVEPAKATTLPARVTLGKLAELGG